MKTVLLVIVASALFVLPLYGLAILWFVRFVSSIAYGM